MKGLEFLLKAAASIAIGLGSLLGTAKAGVEPQMVTFSSPEKIEKTTISPYWIAWQEENDIWYASRSDINNPYQLTASGNAHHPDLDGDTAVYEENGNICSFNLRTRIKKYLYRPVPYEICSQPKINGNGVVFHVKTNLAEPKEEIWAYLIRERRIMPITNSGNPKGIPDIYWPWVVWPELVNKENSLPGLVGGDMDIQGFNLETFKEFVVNNEPNFSSGSCAIYGEKVLYSLNTLPYTQSGCKTFLGAYYILRKKHRASFEEPTGEIHNLAMHGDVLTWERIFERRNKADGVQAMVIRDGISPGFDICGSGGNEHSPDVCSDSDDPSKGAISYVRNDIDEIQEFVITTGEETRVLDASEEKSLLFTGGIRYDEKTAFFDLLRENWLRRKGPMDFDKSGSFDFKDYATLIRRMFK